MASGDTLLVFPATAWQPRCGSSATAQFEDRGGGEVPGWQFDETATEHIFAEAFMPSHYADITGIDVTIWWAPRTLGTGNVMWEVGFERIIPASTVLTTDGFASMQPFAASAAPAVANEYTTATLSVTKGINMDSVVAGDPFRMRIMRDADDASDTYADEAFLTAVLIEET